MAQATSITSSVLAPTLSGVWVHDPSLPQASISNYLYGNVGRSEGLSVENTELRFIGRSLPVYDMGGFESQELSIDITIPYGPDEQDQVEWFRTAVRSRRTLCYRDNRGRLTYGIIGNISFKDEKEGTSVSFTFHTADFTEEI
jgi:hypothetical protein